MGRRHTEETKRKIKEARTKQIITEEHKKKIRQSMLGKNLGKKLSETHKKKIKEARANQVITEETKIKMSQSKMGNTNGFKKGMIGRKGSNSPNWKGGLTKTLEKLEEIAGRTKPILCEICKRPGRICFDHNHKTGKFRGWICHKCNLSIGLVDDKVEILNLLIEYLKK